MTYKTRRAQIEKDFLVRIVSAFRKKGITLPREIVSIIKAELGGAAMVGACEERDRTLNIVRNAKFISSDRRILDDAITAVGVLDVIGYGKSG